MSLYVDGKPIFEFTNSHYDESTRALKAIDDFQHEIHTGFAFTLTRKVTLPAAGDDELLIVTPNTTRWAHMIWSITSDNAFVVDIYEGTGLTTPTDLSSTIANRNRNSSIASGLTIGHTPAGGAGDGALIWSFAGGADKQITTLEGKHKIILKQNEAYLIRVTGIQNDVATILLDWYEHVDRTWHV